MPAPITKTPQTWQTPVANQPKASVATPTKGETAAGANLAARQPKTSKNVTSTVTTLAPWQQSLVGKALPQASAYAREDLSIKPSTELVAPFDPLQLTGQNTALQEANAQQAIANRGAATSQFLMNPAALTAAGNPMEQAAIDAATRPIYQGLTESELPQLRSGAAASGQYGSSRQGIAEGLASGRASQAAGDTAAKIAESAYQSNLDAMTKALGLMPQTEQAQTMPAATISGVGEVRQAQRQASDEANLQRQFYNQNIPLQKAQNLTQLTTGLPGGGTSSSAKGGVDWLQGLLGGASLGNAIVPGGWGAAGGAALGTLLSFLD